MADISKLVVGGQPYTLKDSWARTQIENLIGGGIKFIGKTTTELNDGDHKKVEINGEEVTPKNGDLVIVELSSRQESNQEFVFVGDYGTDDEPGNGKWTELGSTGKLKSFAYVDEGHASYTKPTGSVSLAENKTGLNVTESKIAADAVASLPPISVSQTPVEFENLSATVEADGTSETDFVLTLSKTDIAAAGSSVTADYNTSGTSTKTAIVSGNVDITASVVPSDITVGTTTDSLKVSPGAAQS